MAEYKRIWAQKFKKARQTMGMNRAEFSELLGLDDPKRYYNAIEEGRAAPTNYLKRKLEKLLNG